MCRCWCCSDVDGSVPAWLRADHGGDGDDDHDEVDFPAHLVSVKTQKPFMPVPPQGMRINARSRNVLLFRQISHACYLASS